MRDLFRHPHVRNDREAHLDEMRWFVGEGTQSGKSTRSGDGGELGHHPRSDVVAASLLIDDERTNLGDGSTQRRELGAPDDTVIQLRHDEARRMGNDFVQRPWQEVTGFAIVGHE